MQPIAQAMRGRTGIPSTSAREIHLPYLNLYKDDDGIVMVNLSDNLHLTNKEAPKVVEAINRLTCRVRRAIMIIAGKNTSFEEGFIEYVAFGEKLEYKALAIVAHGIRTATDVSLDSATPVWLFSNEKDATVWLKGQLKIPFPAPTDPDVLCAIHGEGIKIIDEFHHPLFDMYKRSDGIIVRMSSDNAWYTIKEAKESAAALKEITKGNPHLLLSVSGKKSSVDKEGRSFAASAEGLQDIDALAIVTRNLPQRLIGNQMVANDKPPIPIKLFDNANDAIKWLKAQERRQIV